MEDYKRRVIKFLEKEIKTYRALSRFLSKKGAGKHLHVGVGKILVSPNYYKERIREATRLVNELLKAY
jgi:hypothetical protein